MNHFLRRLASYGRLRQAERRISSSMRTGQTRLSYGPSSLNLMMMDTCNAQCLMCGKDYRSCGSNAYLSLGDVQTVYRNLDMQHVVDVIYGGGGEPFLNPDLSAIARFTHKQYPVIQHTVISNFISFKAEAVESMLADSVHFLLSLNAATESTYRIISGIDLFPAVVEHVRRLIEMRRHGRSRSHIALSMILMRQNIDELTEFVNLAGRLGVDEVKTLYVRIYPPEHRNRHGRSVQLQEDDSLYFHQEQSDARVVAARERARQLGIAFEHEPLFSGGRSCPRNCNEAWKSLFVNFNGDVYPCPASEILFKPKVDAGRYASGNILRQHWTEFWNNPFWQAVRASNLPGTTRDVVPECHCCGNAICWEGTSSERAHILDWRAAENSDLSL